MEENNNSANYEYKTWSHNSTKMLIELYKTYRNKVGTFEIRSMKRLWEIISTKLNNEMDINVSASHCENRWRVIERNYTKYVDNNNKTGRGRKDFEYAEEMNEIFGKKKNIFPEILLSQDTNYENTTTEDLTTRSTSTITCDKNVVPVAGPSHENEVNEDAKSTNNITSTPILMTRQVKTKSFKKNRADVLNVMRNDKKKYQEETFNLKKALGERKLLLEEKIRKNNLIEERNKLLEQYLEKNIDLPSFF